MTTAIIIAVVVLIILAIALYATVLSPKAKRERALRKERSHAVEHHREQAQVRESEAERAEREAKERRREAERAEHRAQERRLAAEEHQERAELHEDGRADHELEHGPDEPQPVAGSDRGGRHNPLDRDHDGHVDRDDLRPAAHDTEGRRSDAGSVSADGDRAVGDTQRNPVADQTRERTRITDDVRDSGRR
jgi:type II secretory pathway pseudopilin PulG